MPPPDATDITCRAIMDPAPVVLSADTPFRDAVRSLLQQRVLAMPVVDDQGRYRGVLRKNRILSGVLPQVAVHEDRFHQVTRLIDAGLLRDNLQEVQQRFASIAHDPVHLHACKETPVLRPDQPLVTALYYLYRGRNFLPVVDPADGRLCGVVSTWDVLEAIIGDR